MSKRAMWPSLRLLALKSKVKRQFQLLENLRDWLWAMLLEGIKDLGSISAALSSPVFVHPREEEESSGRSAGSFPKQRLVIEPRQGLAHQQQFPYKS